MRGSLIIILISTVVVFLMIGVVAFFLFWSSDNGVGELVNINSDSKVGCRSPLDDGCEECLIIVNDSCTKLSASGFEFSDVELWYNKFESSDCNNDLPECAQCLKSDEISLINFMEDERLDECDCESIEIGIDPCFHPRSCGCFCSGYNESLTRCPLEK